MVDETVAVGAGGVNDAVGNGVGVSEGTEVAVGKGALVAVEDGRTTNVAVGAAGWGVTG